MVILSPLIFQFKNVIISAEEDEWDFEAEEQAESDKKKGN